jgi:hypothetical protein
MATIGRDAIQLKPPLIRRVSYACREYYSRCCVCFWMLSDRGRNRAGGRENRSRRLGVLPKTQTRCPERTNRPAA